jgi:hypothetical protein
MKFNIQKLTLLIVIFLTNSIHAQTSPPAPPATRNQTCTSGGDQSVYGINSWIGYVYTYTARGNPPAPTPFQTYAGYVTEPDTIFDRNWDTGGPTCTGIDSVNRQRFAVRYRMNKTFVCGAYDVTVGGDDGFRLSIDGGATWIIDRWITQPYNTYTTTILFNASTDLVLEYYESYGKARISFTYALSTPTSIPATIVRICTGDVTTLSGVSQASFYTYSWTGSSIISGANTFNPVVNPGLGTTTYTLVTTNVNTGCSFTSTVNVTVTNPLNPGSIVQPTVFGTNVWNVYGFNGNNRTISSNVFRGNYVQPALTPATDFGVDTKIYWNENSSPSNASFSGNIWNGCAVNTD